jgi:hypothetical protein
MRSVKARCEKEICLDCGAFPHREKIPPGKGAGKTRKINDRINQIFSKTPLFLDANQLSIHQQGGLLLCQPHL